MIDQLADDLGALLRMSCVTYAGLGAGSCDREAEYPGYGRIEFDDTTPLVSFNDVGQRIDYLQVWDAAVGGNMLAWVPLSRPAGIGDTVQLKNDVLRQFPWLSS